MKEEKVGSATLSRLEALMLESGKEFKDILVQ